VRLNNEENLVRFLVQPTTCAAECAVRFEPLCANTGFFDTSAERFRAGLVVGK
jgi:hypothetical protein